MTAKTCQMVWQLQQAPSASLDDALDKSVRASSPRMVAFLPLTGTSCQNQLQVVA
ncbi:MAG: hypothetical protein AABZ77_00550 [Chloroflexota bacterium]